MTPPPSPPPLKGRGTGGEVITGKFPGACAGIKVKGLPWGSY